MRSILGIQCIVPPHILREISNRGSQRQRDRVWRTITLSEQMRGQRIAIQRGGATTGASPGQKQRTIYDAGTGYDLPGTLARSEGGPASSDVAVNEAYEGSGSTYDLYWSVYQRNSIDDHGMSMLSTVHYGQGYDNAFWNGKQMVYGDGDSDLPESERLFNRFTIALEVIGHELTHGVTQYEADLAYRSQPGALNESFSDVLGVLVKQRALGQTAAEASWLIGEGLLTSNVKGVAIRSMKEPGTAYDDPVLGKDPQPGHMDQYQNLPAGDDNGGVHINSGIPNHAFYFVAMELGGYAWDKAGQIWYVTLRDRLRSTSDFQDAANKTYAVAGELYGIGSLERQAVKNGWSKVGITATEAKTGGGKGRK